MARSKAFDEDRALGMARLEASHRPREAIAALAAEIVDRLLNAARWRRRPDGQQLLQRNSRSQRLACWPHQSSAAFLDLMKSGECALAKVKDGHACADHAVIAVSEICRKFT